MVVDRGIDLVSLMSQSSRSAGLVGALILASRLRLEVHEVS